MHNSDQVREFFRRMADGLAINSTLSYATVSGQDNRSVQERQAADRSKKFADFGVGLPPMAHS